MRLRRRGKNGRGNRVRAPARYLLLQRRKRAGIAAHQPGRRAIEKNRAGRGAGESGRGRHTHAKITTGTYENKFGIAFEEIEDRLCPRRQAEKPPPARTANAHRLADHERPAHSSRRCAKSRRWRIRLKEKHGLEFFSLGGGLGIVYRPALASGAANWWKSAAARKIITPQKYAARLTPLLQPLGLRILLNRAIHLRQRRPSRHPRRICETHGPEKFRYRGRGDERSDPAGVLRGLSRNRAARPQSGGARIESDVVGPICESGDFFCKDRPLPKVREGDYLRAVECGRLRLCDGVELQLASAGGGVSGERTESRCRARTPAGERNLAGEKIAPWLK